jgi:hypothetical protein
VATINPNIISKAILSDYVAEADLAKELNVTVRTLARWRALRIGPDPTKIGRRVYYSPEARARWLQSREHPARPRDRRRGRRS